MNRPAGSAEPDGKSVISSESESQPSADEIRRNVSLKMAITARQLRRHFDQIVAELGVTRSQWTVISAVSRLPGATQRTLAQILEMSEASAGRLVDRLCADGLLLRRAKDEDRRAHCVYLTPSGEGLIADLTKIAIKHENMAFAGLEREDLKQLETVLDRILGNLGRPNLAGDGDTSGTRRRRPKQPPA